MIKLTRKHEEIPLSLFSICGKRERKGGGKDRINMIRGSGKQIKSIESPYILLTILLRASGWSWARQSPPAGAFGSTPAAAGSDPWVGRQLALASMVPGPDRRLVYTGWVSWGWKGDGEAPASATACLCIYRDQTTAKRKGKEDGAVWLT